MKSQIASNSKYKITIYHGGEMPEETLYAQTLEEAQRKSMRGEYSEIIDLTTNKMVYGHGGDIAKSNLDMVKSYSKEFIHHGEELQKVLKNDPEVEGWVVAKGERATTDLSDITHYLDGTSEYGAGGVVNFYSPEWIVIGKDNETQKWVIVSPKPDFVAVANKMKKAMLEGARYKKLRLQYSDFKVINEEDFDENMVFKFAKGGQTAQKKDWEVVGTTMQGQKFKKIVTLGRLSTESDVRQALKKMQNDKFQVQKVTTIKEMKTYAQGGKITTNSKQVREAIKQHILENVYDENEEQFKTLDGATQYLAEEFKRVADHRNNLARYPNNQERFTDYLRGIPFNFYFYNDDIEDFLNGLGINPNGKKYTPDQMWKLYGALIWKEVSPKYSRYGQGGEVGSYNNPQNSIHVLHVDGQNWFLSKIDSTHFYISNNANVKGSAQHIGQHNGESYYEEIRQWLKSSKFAEGGEVSKWSVSDITDAEYVGIVEFQDNQGEYHNFEIMETADKLVFGGFTNSGFIESGYIEKDGFSTDQVLQELLEDLEVYYNDGEQYTSMIVVNQRMARGGQMDKGGMIYALAEFVSSGTIANKTNYEKYDDISAIRTKAIQYYIENGDKPYSMGELERVLKMVSIEKFAEGGEVGEFVQIGKFRRNILGTLSFELKLKKMRKAQDFSVYPAQEKTDYITIQSQTRFGKIEMTTGRGLMSQSHTNGAYSYHFQMDRKEKFQLTNEQLSELKKELAKTAGKEVGNMGVISDNTYADQFAKGGNVEGLQTEIHNLKRKLVAQAKSKGISENFGQKEVRMLEEKYPMNYSVGQFDEWVQNFDLDSYANGGKLSNKATYIPKRDIAEVEVEKDDKTTYVDGANLYDGVYVKKGKFAKGGKTSRVNYNDILPILKEKLEDGVEILLPNDFENSSEYKGEEVESKSRDGFIAFTDGGYEVTWFEYVSMFNGGGYKLPTKALDNELQRQVEYNYQYAKDRIKDLYPEIVEELGEDNIDYSSLNDAGYESIAEQLSEYEMDNNDTIMCSVGAYYYSPENSRSKDGKHTIRVFGVVNLESPYHRRGNLEDSIDIDITFDSIEEMEEKLDYEISEICSGWFNGANYNESTEKLRVVRMAKGGKLSNNATYIPKRDIAEVEVEKDGKTTFVDGANLYDGVYVKKGKFAKGGMVTKGELVWKKLSSSDKIIFLLENFTPEITPRGQEILVGKSYNFLPKNVKQVLQSKYANVEEYAKGGKLSNKATYIPKRDIAEVEVEKDGKTTFVDGANLYDGVYVKKGKFAKGGQAFLTIADLVQSALEENYDYPKDEADEITEYFYSHIQNMHNMGKSADEIADDVVRLLNERAENLKKKMKFDNDYVVVPWDSSEANKFAKGGEVSTYKKANWRFW